MRLLLVRVQPREPFFVGDILMQTYNSLEYIEKHVLPSGHAMLEKHEYSYGGVSIYYSGGDFTWNVCNLTQEVGDGKENVWEITRIRFAAL